MLVKELKIPTLLGLLILAIGVGSGVFLIENFQQTLTKASPSTVPQEMKITNIGHSFFTVSWITEKKTTGSLKFSENKDGLERIGFDDRDQDGKLRNYFTHYITLRNLDPGKTYYFKIISENDIFDNNSLPFSSTTASLSQNPPSTIEPAYGSVFNINEVPAEGAIVYLTLEKTFPLSTLVKPSGNWLIPLNTARTQDLKNYHYPQEREKVEVFIRASRTETAQAITDTLNDSPVPDIIIGKSYDFRGIIQGVKAKNTKDLNKKKLSEVVLKSTTSAKKVSILTPNENQAFSSFKPLFRGTGVPNKEVIIVVKSSIQTGKVVVSSDGTWHWTPAQDLSPGEHTFTLTTRDDNDNPVTLSRNFLVFKSGTQVLGEATPSATLTPSPSPSPNLSPSPTFYLSPSPTATPSAPPVPGNLQFTGLILGVSSLLIFFGIKSLLAL